MQIKVIPVSLFQSNCIVVWDEATMEAVVFDPGGEPERILRVVETLGVSVKGIFLTHGHVDHVAGTNKIRDAFGAKSHMHGLDKPLAQHTPRQCLMFGIPVEEAPAIDVEVSEGDRFSFSFGGLKFSAMHFPGHSPGSVAYVFEGEKPVMISGDLLFAGSIGRVDLPGGDEEQMQQSLDRVKELPDDMLVVPGHGPNTTVGREKASNPYLRGSLLAW